jgi:sugar phosphate isomerase/epimerase
MGSGASRSVPEGYEAERALEDFAKAVRMAATLAAGAGITIAVEALQARETNLLNTVGATADFVRGLALPNVKCTADFYHMESDRESLAALGAAGKLIGHAHLADSARSAPGSGSADIGGFLLALKRAGYDGRVSIEANWHDFDAQVGPALRFLKDTWSRVRVSSAE